ncbi:TRAP transporter small permease [bacterium LRH843]|nr:TRAP transporter small permease [bacterium LRH843]
MKIKRSVEKLDNTLAKIEGNIVFVLLFLMLVIVFASVINRFIFNGQIRWAEELSRYIMIWASFIGASLGVKKGAHISVDAFVSFLPLKFKKITTIVSNFISLAFCLAVLFIGIPFIMNLLETGQMSPALRIPMYYAYLSVIVGIGLMAIRYIILIIYEVFLGGNPEVDNGGIL